MKLKTRFENFLAKIAGEDVDISTLTPPVPANTTEELMLKIADKQLPEVTKDDEGKVLKVVDGEWAKGEAGGGGGAFVVNFTATRESITADKTYNEIIEAMKTMPVVGVLKEISEGEEYITPMGTAMNSLWEGYETPCWCCVGNPSVTSYNVTPAIGWDSLTETWKLGAVD